MNLKKTNPCEYPALVKLLQWGETDCWCCTTIRGIVAAAPISFAVGLVAGGKIGIGVIVGILGLAASIAFLRFARAAWDDGEGEKQ